MDTQIATICEMGFPGGSKFKASTCNVGDLGSISGSGRCPGEGNGNPLQYSCLGNPVDAGAWWPTVHRVAKSRTRLSDFTFTFTFYLGCCKIHCNEYRSTDIFSNQYFILFRSIPKSVITGSYGSFKEKKRHPHTVFNSVSTNLCSLQQCTKSALLSTFLLTVVICCVFDNNHSDRFEVVHCGFDLYFPGDKSC